MHPVRDMVVCFIRAVEQLVTWTARLSIEIDDAIKHRVAQLERSGAYQEPFGPTAHSVVLTFFGKSNAVADLVSVRMHIK